MSGADYDAGWADGWAGRPQISADENYDLGYRAGKAEWAALEKAEAQADG